MLIRMTLYYTMYGSHKSSKRGRVSGVRGQKMTQYPVYTDGFLRMMFLDWKTTKVVIKNSKSFIDKWRNQCIIERYDFGQESEVR